MKIAAVSLAIAFTPAVALADSVPRYDVGAYCGKVAEAVGGSAQIENTCITQEQNAYNGLKARWLEIDTKAKSYCDRVASAVGGTYQIMSTCIDQETSAANSKPGFEY